MALSRSLCRATMRARSVAAAHVARDTRGHCAVQRRRCRSRRARQRSLTPASLVPRRALHRADKGGAPSVLHPGMAPSSTFGSTPRIGMDRTARLFLCARCRDQVLLCSHCDHGQQYCSRACSSSSRRERRRESAARYQRSRDGRLKHAARTACWRRLRSLRRVSAGGGIDKVTHQGCLQPSADDSLRACDTPSACESSIEIESANDGASATANTAPWAALRCRRCAQPLLPHVRLSWLRPRSVRWRDAHDHPS